jgi:pentatricopeptide repeat protein
MEATGCTPDVVTYTSLISAYERGGQWHLALQAFQRMLAQGCRPDAIVYNAIIDALWQTGVVWAQVRGAARARWQEGPLGGSLPPPAAFVAGPLQRASLKTPRPPPGPAPSSVQAKALELYQSAAKQGHLRSPRPPPDGAPSAPGGSGAAPGPPSGGESGAGSPLAGSFPSESALSTLSSLAGSSPAPSAAALPLGGPGGPGARGELNLHALTAGVAMISLYLWLHGLRDAAAAGGPGALPGVLAIVTDAGSSSREQVRGTCGPRQRVQHVA